MKILIAGDYCPQNRVAKIFESGDYASVFGDVMNVIKKTDYSIVNFECVITRDGGKPIIKAGTNLRCSVKGIDALKWCGFSCVTLANNHFYDFGDEGVTNTLETCQEYGMDYVGGGKNLQEAIQPLYKKIGGRSLAIINCCEHEFSIATEKRGGGNPLNPIQQYYYIKEAKSKVDFVVVISHGGPEHFPLPTPRMQETFRFFIDAGADAVINHHQHCCSGYEIYKKKPIFYGIGNFCFDNKLNKSELWYDGLMIILNMDQEISFEMIPIHQCEKQAIVRLGDYDSFKNRIDKFNSIINLPEKLNREVNSYYESCINLFYTDIFEPISNRYYFACKHRGWLPSLMSSKRKLMAFNHIWCEAHRDKLLFLLNKMYENINK